MGTSVMRFQTTQRERCARAVYDSDETEFLTEVVVTVSLTEPIYAQA